MDISQEARASRAVVFDEMDRAHVDAGRAERRRLKAILECDRHELWRGHGARDHAEFLAGRYGMSKWKARRMIAAAYTLEHLPLTSHALETGVLSVDKVVELTRFAVPATEKKLITWAKRVTPGGIRARGDEETRRTLKEIQDNEKERSLTWYSHELGFQMEGRMTHEAGAAFAAAIDRLAAELPDVPIGPDMRLDEERSLEQRRADALFLLCTQGAPGKEARPTVVVHAPLEAMTTSSRNGVTEDGTALHPATTQRLACEGHIDVVLYDRDRVVDMARSSREPSPQMRRQVLKRDGHTCAFQGCGQKRFLKIHHMEPWTPRGETKLDNLITLCHSHHKLVHEQGWGVRIKDGATPEWFTPGGRVFEPGPAPPADGRPPPEASSDPMPWGRLWHWLEDVDPESRGGDPTKRFLKLGRHGVMPGPEKGRGRIPVCETPTSSMRSERPWGDSGERSRPSGQTTSRPIRSGHS